MTNEEAGEAIENPSTVPWTVALHPITGRWRIVAPMWEMTPIGGAVTLELSRTICERVVAAVWADEMPQEAFWRARAAYNAEQIKKLEERVATLTDVLSDARTVASNAERRELMAEDRAVKAEERAAYLDGVLADLSHERDTLVQERDSALAVIDMVNRSANAWAKGCDRAERTIERLKARIGRLKLRGRAA